MKEKVTVTQKALNLWAIILIFWSFYRSYFGQDLPVWFDELIVKPLFFVVPVYWYTVRFEKKPFFKSLFLDFKKAVPDLLYGGAIGLVFLLVSMLSYALKTGTLGLARLFTWQIAGVLALSVATSISEEILSRGFVLRHVWEGSKNFFRSVFTASGLYIFLHLPILLTSPGLTGGMLLQVLIMDFVLSVAVSVLFLERKSLLVAIIVHALYAFALSVFL